jgi:subtilisin family serine protease
MAAKSRTKKTPKKPAKTNAQELVRTFQGRPVVTVEWHGEEVEAVRGMVAYRSASQVKHEDAEHGLMVDVLGTMPQDPLGIGVIITDAHVGGEHAASAADNMGQDVLWTEPVLLDHGCLIPDDTYFAQQWNLSDIKASRAWDIWNGDPRRVVVAVLDTGIATESGSLSHSDLNDATRFFLGRDLVNNDDDPSDDHGHGTHVAGIIAAIKNNSMGVAGLWPGPLLALKVLNSTKDGSSVVFKDGVLAAVRFASDHNAHLIINYSGGGPDSQTKKTAVEYAGDNGALMVAAAGNEFGGKIIFPAAYSTQFSHVIAVGAVDQQHKRPSFASRGPEMTLVAPGVGVLSSLPNYFVTLNNQGKQTKYDRLDGTSQSAPLVAALAALVWSKWPDLNASQVRDKLMQSADTIEGSENDYGHGMINAEAALS